MSIRKIRNASEEERHDLAALSRVIEAVCKRDKNKALREINDLIASKQNRKQVYDRAIEQENNGQIASFMLEQATGNRGKNYYYSYPVQFLDKELVLQEGYIYGTLYEYNGGNDEHTLKIIILDKNEKDYHKIIKRVKAPKNTILNWDKIIHCTII